MIDAAAAQAANAVRVDLTPLSGAVYAAEYRLEQAVASLKFERKSRQRLKEWKSSDPNIVVTEADVHSADGKPFRHLQFRLELTNIGTARAYPPIAVFGDGSSAVFSDHLMPDTGNFSTTFHLTPRAGEQVSVRDKTSTAAITWRDDERGAGPNGGYMKVWLSIWPCVQ